MNEKYNALFTPWKIGNVEIKNRIVQCSMGGTSLFGWMEPNHFDKEAAYFLLNRAQDGVGLILPGMQCIRDPLGIPGRKWLYQNDQMFKQLKEYMVEFHKTGAKLFIQLAAGMGRSMAINSWMTKLAKNNVLNKIASPIVDVQYICASASEVPNRWKEDVMSRPLTVKEIEDMVYAFGQTAKKLRAAGVDGVEIHAVHEGYLLDQFTMANWNHRTDKYGGSFENRFRFPVEIVQEIKRQAGSDFPVSLRYSVVSKTKAWGKGAMPYETDFVEFGRDMPESEKAVKYLEDAGYDMFNCDNGTYDAWYWAHPPQYMPDNCNLEYVEHIKQFTSRPVVCAGRMDPVKAAEEIAAGRLDAVAIARQNLVDHEVAVVGMGPVVSKNVTVDDLSLEQLKGIFSGQITNWKEVGGDDATIVVLNRKAGSGTRATFEAAVFGDEAVDFKGDAELDKSGDVQTQMGSTDNAISYLDFSHFDDSKFNAIKVEGVEPKSANVTDDSFKIWATEHMYCAKDADEATTAFLEFMLSDDVQGKLVEEQGFIPVSAMKVVKDASGKVSAK